MFSNVEKYSLEGEIQKAIEEWDLTEKTLKARLGWVDPESVRDLEPNWPYLKNGKQWYKIEDDLTLTACERPIEETACKEYIPNIIIVLFLVGLLVTLSEWCI